MILCLVDDLSDDFGTTDGASIISGQNERQSDDLTSLATSDTHKPKRTLVLRGQMLYMQDWQAILFLGTPVSVFATTSDFTGPTTTIIGFMLMFLCKIVGWRIWTTCSAWASISMT